jgi:hypothetical protein
MWRSRGKSYRTVRPLRRSLVTSRRGAALCRLRATADDVIFEYPFDFIFFPLHQLLFHEDVAAGRVALRVAGILVPSIEPANTFLFTLHRVLRFFCFFVLPVRLAGTHAVIAAAVVTTTAAAY